MLYTVYIIQCDKDRYYIGQTKNIETRLATHNKGISNWTKNYNNWELIYKEEYKTRGI